MPATLSAMMQEVTCIPCGHGRHGEAMSQALHPSRAWARSYCFGTLLLTLSQVIYPTLYHAFFSCLTETRRHDI